MPPELSWEMLRRATNLAAIQDGEWAGAPMPVHELPLVVEPRYPYAGLNGAYFQDDSLAYRERGPDDSGVVVHNSWYSTAHSATVYICSDSDSPKRWHVLLPEWGSKRLTHWLYTLGASQAWSVAAELQALQKLQEHTTAQAYRTYLLTGTFLETSRRSGVTYLFRKLRPTVALRSVGGQMHILSVLCLHPIGYYEGSWAGALCPTDDVLAHLLLMRADEHRFWAKSNHHPTWAASAGI